jgi:ribonuclease-3
MTLLQTALTHKSYAMDYKNPPPHQERMEFLGDAILWAIIADLLYTHHADQDEAQLTIAKVSLVREEMLAHVARSLQLWSYIRLSNWERGSGGDNKNAVLSDSLEALIAYAYLHLWWSHAYSFVEKHIWSLFEGWWAHATMKSPKNRLQERVQATYQCLPIYTDIEITDPTTKQISYQSTVRIQDTETARGLWSNKKKAQEDAASNAIVVLQI